MLPGMGKHLTCARDRNAEGQLANVFTPNQTMILIWKIIWDDGIKSQAQLPHLLLVAPAFLPNTV